MARNKNLIERRDKDILKRFIELRIEQKRNKRQAIDKMVNEFYLSSRTIHNIIFAKKFKMKRKTLAVQCNLFEIK